MSTSSKSPYDLVILGGGLAGLSLALQCEQRTKGIRIAVLEKNRHPVPEAAFKVGESSVEVAAEYFGNVLGLKEHILLDQLPKLGLRFFFPRNGNHCIEDRLELGGRRYPPTPSYQLDRGRFENFLAVRCVERGVEFLDGAKVREVTLTAGRKPHLVGYSRDGVEHDCAARWVVDASGRAGILKRKLGLAKSASHLASAAWFRINSKISVDDWSGDPSWLDGHEGMLSRWYSTNHLMGEGYWVWLIPLASGSTSVGIVADERIHPRSTYNSIEKALTWLKKFEPQCAAKVEAHIDKLQDFRVIKHYCMDCKQVFSHKRWGLTGEAGYFLDPFYSPGSDFIAFANTFLCELIDRDMRGKTNQFHARTYEEAFRRFYHGTLVSYQDQYPLFGNHQVMPIKVLWDYLMYWTLTGYLYFHDQTRRPLVYLRNIRSLTRLNNLNKCMQRFFRHWHEQGRGREVGGLINMSEIPLIFEMNQALQDKLTSREFAERFTQNADLLEELFWEIYDFAGMDFDVPFRRRSAPRSAPERRFELVYRAVSGTVRVPRAAEQRLRAAAGGAGL